MKKKSHIKEHFLSTLLFLGIFLFASCSSNEPVDVTSNETVGFSITQSEDWGNGSSSRATVIDLKSLYTQGFGVFAYYTQNKPWGSYQQGSAPNFMNNIKVYSTDNGVNWTYSPLKYWLGYPGEYTSFFAYAPYNANTTINGSEINFTVNETVKNQVDLMWSNTETTDLTRRDEAIGINFLHALAKIGFTAQANIEGTTTTAKVYIRIQKLVLTSPTDNNGTASTGPFYTEGTLDLKNTTNVASWEATNTERKFNLDYSNFVGAQSTGFLLTKEDNESAKPLNADDSYVMIIPQSETCFNVYVEYEVRLEGADHNVYESYTNKRAGTLKLNFEAGKAYTLNLIFGLDEFTIDENITVTSWTPVTEVEIDDMVP